MTMLRETSMSAIHREQWVPASLPAVFSFFSDAGNLDRITPPWLRFKILGQSELVLSTGTLIHYRLAWYGIPMKWTSRIEEWFPPTRFVDVQLKGPYRRWHHTHTFESARRRHSDQRHRALRSADGSRGKFLCRMDGAARC